MHIYINQRKQKLLRTLLFIVTFVLGISSIYAQDISQRPDEIATINYSPDGLYIAVAGGPFGCLSPEITASNQDLLPFAIRIIDANSLNVIKSLTGHRCRVNTVSWSPNGLFLVSSSMDGSTHVWNVETETAISGPPNSFENSVSGSTWNASGTLIVDFYSRSGAGARIWNPTDGSLIASLNPENSNSPTYAVAWSPNGNRIAQADAEGNLHIWDVNAVTTGVTSQPLATYSNLPAASLAWSPDGSQLALGGTNILIVNPDTGTISQTLAGHERVIVSLSWNSLNNMIASASLDGIVKVWDRQSGELVTSYNYGTAVWAVTWSPNSAKIAYGGVSPTPQPAILTQVVVPVTIDSFVLIDSITLEELQPLTSGITLEPSSTIIYHIKALTLPINVGSVKFNLNGVEQIHNTAPYEFENWSPTVGTHTLTATPYSGADGTGTPGTPLTINFEVISSAAISSLSLVNPGTGTGIVGFDPIENNATIDLGTMTISPVHIIAAPTVSPVGSVKFVLDSGTPYNDSSEPYQIENWIPTLGSHSLTATPYSGANGTGTPGTALTINFTVTNSLNRILYVHNSNIYVMNADGTNPVNLVAGDSPSWSPDGTRIAYHAPMGGSREIFVMNADGSNILRLTTNAADDRNPSWSPDGSGIVYASVSTNSDWELYIMNADGTNKVQLTNNTIDDTDPSWSSTDIIAFVAMPGDYRQIFTVWPNGSHRTQVSSGLSHHVGPEWSPDGSMILFNTTAGTNDDVRRINADGSNGQRLTSNASSDINPEWSQDGTQIIFSSDRAGGTNRELYIMNIDGSAQTRFTITSGISETAPAWGYP